MSKRLTVEEFIIKAKLIHGNKYDYSKVEYVDTNTKVCIICPIHGEFWQTPHSHLSGKGCKCCKQELLTKVNTLTTEEFIERAKKIHGNKYDYSNVDYINAHTKVCIICPIHGEFWQIPNDHLSGKGCKFCNHQSFKYTTEEYIKKAKQIHGDKYDYSKVNYTNMKTPICVICPIHGEFWINPHNHLCGNGCEICGGSKKFTTEEFIKRARQIHGNKYDYSKVEYINNHTAVCIICPIHGEFWQIPNGHLQGHGCYQCQTSKLEQTLNDFLNEKHSTYERQKHFDWLNQLSLDFYLPQYNIAVECQGIQHFKPIEYFGGEKTFKEQQERDERKRRLCEENGVKLLYYSNLGIEYPYKVYENLDDLLKEIKSS